MKLKTKFQDEYFDFGEVVEAHIYHGDSKNGIKVIAEPAKGGIITLYFKTLKEMNEMFEDYEELYYYINDFGAIQREYVGKSDIDEMTRKDFGNHFDTEEETEKAVEKIKAWQRLRKNHFKFDEYDILNQTATWLVSREYDQYENDIKLLFGGEE